MIDIRFILNSIGFVNEINVPVYEKETIASVYVHNILGVLVIRYEPVLEIEGKNIRWAVGKSKDEQSVIRFAPIHVLDGNTEYDQKCFWGAFEIALSSDYEELIKEVNSDFCTVDNGNLIPLTPKEECAGVPTAAQDEEVTPNGTHDNQHVYGVGWNKFSNKNKKDDTRR